MIITYAANSNAWIACCGRKTNSLDLAPAGFRWSEDYGMWFTRNPDVADALQALCSDRARRAIDAMRRIRSTSSPSNPSGDTRVEDLFYAAGWSIWALGERLADGIVSPIGEVPLQAPLELLAGHFGRLIVERLGSCELHWLPNLSEIVDKEDATDPWVARWHAASDPERVDLDQRAFEIAIQTVLHGSASAAESVPSQLHHLRSIMPSRLPNARKAYAKYRAMERKYSYQLCRFEEPQERGSGKPGETDSDEDRKSATIHYLRPPLRDDRWWKGW